MSRQIETTIAEAAARNLSVSATLERLADMELEARRGRAIERRFRCSRLQSQPGIDAFHFHHHKSRVQAKNRILRLLDLTFLPLGTNVVLIGNPGVGKTFLARILAWKACQANQRVLFTTAMDMLNHLSVYEDTIWLAQPGFCLGRPPQVQPPSSSAGREPDRDPEMIHLTKTPFVQFLQVRADSTPIDSRLDPPRVNRRSQLP